MASIIIILIILGVFALWITAGVKLFRFGAPGIRYFFTALIMLLVLAAVVFVLLVVPTFDCTGFLCGLEEVLLFIGICILLLLVFPLFMLTKGVSTLRKTANEVKKEELHDNDLLDS